MEKKNIKDSLTIQNAATAGFHADETAKASGVSKQRRKLIKASITVVPAIMTLRSGAVAAIATTYQCVAGDNARAQLQFPQGAPGYVLGDNPGEPSEDTWLRIMGRAGNKVTWGTNVRYFIRKALDSGYTWDQQGGWDCYDQNGGTASIPSAQRWNNRVPFWCAPNGSGGWVCYDNNGIQLTLNSGMNTPIQNGKVMPLLAQVEFDPSGAFTGNISYYPRIRNVVTAPPGYTPITGSCWCSVNPDYNIL